MRRPARSATFVAHARTTATAVPRLSARPPGPRPMPACTRRAPCPARGRRDHRPGIEIDHATAIGVAFGSRHQQPQPAARCHQPSDAGRSRRVLTDGGAQQRTPREVDGDEGCKAGQLGRQLLHSRRDEARVRQSALSGRSRGTTRGIAHGLVARVDGEHQLVRMISRLVQDVASITRTQVDRDGRVRGGKVGQLADVHLGEATSSHESHEPIIPPPRAGRTGR